VIIPCIDLMGGKVVQLVQGRFARFPQIQMIDLDAAMGQGSNDDLVELVAARAVARVGGGVRSAERARGLVEQGAFRVIAGTAAFDKALLNQITDAVGPERLIIALDSKGGKVVVKGWREATEFTAEEMIPHLEPYCSGFLCTYVDKEGMLQGTDLNWFRRLRALTQHELTAAGGITTIEEIRELQKLGIHAALGMAIYTGRLNIEELAVLTTLPYQ
jgi:phosphoribosylformimino-5-aminoimidazole carboxamide ribotide isomerase